MQQAVNLIHFLGGRVNQQGGQIILVHTHSPRLSIGCLGRAGFTADSGCDSTSGTSCSGTSKSAMASYCRNICCIAHCISPASINSRFVVPGVATSAKLSLRPALASVRLMASKVMDVTVGKVISLAPNFFNSASMLDFLKRFVRTLAGLWTMT